MRYTLTLMNSEGQVARDYPHIADVLGAIIDTFGRGPINLVHVVQDVALGAGYVGQVGETYISVASWRH